MSKRSQKISRKNERKPRLQKKAPVHYHEFEGIARMNREGHIYVKVEELEEEIFVKAGRTRGALNGDRVRVAVTHRSSVRHGLEGEIFSIIERNDRPMVGIYHPVGRQAWVLMSSRTMPYDIEVPIPDGEIKRGMKVAAVVDGWERGASCPHGHIVDILGMPGENETEMHAILAEFGLPYRFEPYVERAADKISDEITDKDRAGRRDFRKTLTFTIDPADAKDFDDALSFRKLDNGNFEVGIHIADVSYYVKPNTAVDKEAQARGTSVYLVDRTVPMLPEKLSNKLCSLRPHEEKLCFSAVFEITPQAKVINPWFGRTEIISDYRFAYELAQEIIDAGAEAMQKEFGEGSECGLVPADVKEAVLKLNDLALKLRRKRFAAGAINFERPEMKVDIDENGKPIAVHQRVSKEANWLIEEFMLLANRNVAEFVATGGKFGGKALKAAKTFVYRVHDEPNGEKIARLREFAGNFGLKMGETGAGRQTARSVNALLDGAKDTPAFNALELLALRAMAKACYSTDNIGHYGLAFPFYTHFTSPIRRYPDMMVHRLLAMYLDGADSQNKDYYTDQCRHASEREVVAAEAERESIKYKVIEYMQDKIGMEFNGTISSLTEWGMYVEVEDTHIEGMIPLRTIRSDFYDFDPDRYLVRGRRTGHIFRLGDPVRIRVKESNLEQRLLDYELIEEHTSAPDERPSRFSDDKPYRPEGEYHHYRSEKGSRKGSSGSKSASRSGKSRKK